eukprot:m.133961 g.133961  ORF g.133961 m.133961 type:complete len:1489 (+) comp29710_c0_seq1:303-4769(+)
MSFRTRRDEDAYVNDESDTDDDPDVMAALHQLKYEREVLIREKKQMAEYMAEVEEAASEKEKKLDRLNEQLTRESRTASTAQRQVSELEKQLKERDEQKEVRVRSKRRTLPQRPSYEHSLKEHTATMRATPDEVIVDPTENDMLVKNLQADILRLESALGESRSLLEEQQPGVNDQEGGNKNDLDLDSEMRDACRNVDEAAIFEMAQRFNEMNEQLMEAEQQLQMYQGVQEQLDMLTDHNESLQVELQDVLDENARLQTALDTKLPEPRNSIANAVESLADELTPDLEATIAQLREQIAKLEAELEASRKENVTLSEEAQLLLSDSQLLNTDIDKFKAQALQQHALLQSQLESRELKLGETKSDLKNAEAMLKQLQLDGEKSIASLKARYETDLQESDRKSRESHAALEKQMTTLSNALEHSNSDRTRIVQDLESQLKESKAETVGLQAQLAEISTNSSESTVRLKKALKTAEDQITIKNEEYSQQSAHLEDITEAWQKATRDLATLRDLMGTMKQHNEQYSEHLKGAHAETRRISTQLADAQELLRKTTSQLDSLKQTSRIAEDDHEVERLRLVTQVSQAKQNADIAVEKAKGTIASLKEQVANVTAQLTVSQTTTNALRTDLAKQHDMLEVMRKGRKEADDLHDTERTTLKEQLRLQSTRHHDEVNVLQKEMAGVAQELELSKQSQQSSSARVLQLESLIEQTKKQRQLTISNMEVSDDAMIGDLQEELKRMTVSLDHVQQDVITLCHDTPTVNTTAVPHVDASFDSKVKLDALVEKVHKNHVQAMADRDARAAEITTALGVAQSEKKILENSNTEKQETIVSLRAESKQNLGKLDDLKTSLESTLAKLKYVSSEFEDAQKILQMSENSTAEAEADVQKARDLAQQYKESLEAKDRKIAEFLSTNTQLEEESMRLRDSNDVMSAELETLKIDLDKARASAETLKADAAAHRIQLDTKFESLHTATNALDVKTRELQELSEIHSRVEAQLKDLQEEHAKLIATHRDTANLLDSEQRKCKQALDDGVSTHTELEALKLEFAKTENFNSKVMGERSKLSKELAISQNECAGLAEDLEANNSVLTSAQGENERLRDIVDRAGANVKRHIEAAEATDKELSRLRRSSQEADLKANRYKLLAEQSQQSGKKIRDRILQKADVEITKQKTRVASLVCELELVKKKMSTLCVKPDLSSVFTSLGDLSAKLETNLATQPAGPPKGLGGEIKDQIGAADTQLQYIVTLVDKVLASKSGKVLRTPHRPIQVRKVPPSRTKLPVFETPKQQASPQGDGAIDRLLGAVKKFYHAKNLADSLKNNQGLSTTTTPTTTTSRRDLVAQPTPATELRQQHQHPLAISEQRVSHFDLPRDDDDDDDYDDDHVHIDEDVLPIKEVFEPTQFSDEADESLEMPARRLTYKEQDKLFTDWVRLKEKVRALILQLVRVKAAIAHMRFQAEKEQVYTRNRDRLVASLLDSCGGKKKKISKLQKILRDFE